MLSRELDVARDAARAAGDVLRAWYGRDCTVKDDGDDRPTLQADIDADRCLKEILTTAFPADGWLSEETRDSPARLQRSRVWVVDPMDGSVEFRDRNPEFAVAIALVDDGHPVLGITYNPMTDELFAAVRGDGTTLNGDRVTASACHDLGAARILTSRTETRRGEWEEFAADLRLQPVGSVAYKLGLVAAGRGDATFSLRPKHEWDVCAGTVLVLEAGGRVTDCYGRPLHYNQPVPWFAGLIACAADLYDPIVTLLRSHGRFAPPATG